MYIQISFSPRAQTKHISEMSNALKLPMLLKILFIQTKLKNLFII